MAWYEIKPPEHLKIAKTGTKYRIIDSLDKEYIGTFIDGEWDESQELATYIFRGDNGNIRYIHQHEMISVEPIE